MVTIRVAAAWLFFVGIISLISSYRLLGVISGRLTLDTALWLFAAPVVLIVGSAVVLVTRGGWIVVAALSLSCAWLTWMFASNYWPRPSPIAPVEYDWLFVVSGFIVVASDTAAILIWRGLYHLTNR
jgi:hypothetical protein